MTSSSTFNSNNIVTLTSARLRLRQWRDDDFPAFAALNADPEVMASFPSVLTTTQSDEVARKLQTFIAKNGWGFWALELRASGEFIGFTGLNIPDYPLPFSPCVEIGWRLAKQYWGLGYASEAAICALNFAFDSLALETVYAFTATTNFRSQALMRRIGMRDTGANFMHPRISRDNPLCEHLLYRIRRSEY